MSTHITATARATTIGALMTILAACSQTTPETDALPRTDATRPDSSASNSALEAGDLRRSGTIEFGVRCGPGLETEFETAVALLHSFFYDEARRCSKY